MQMLCLTFQLPKHIISYRRLRSLDVTFSRSYVREDGLALFGTDDRRDIVSLSGLHDGNQLCCEIVCFIQIHNLRAVLGRELSTTYVIVRWLEPHPDAWERDVCSRPVCPGPLHINNCLWRYALTDSPRNALVTVVNRVQEPSAVFLSQRNIFGSTPTQQDQCRTREASAYYGLVTPESIVKIENMCPLFQRDTAYQNDMMWLQSVVVF